MNNEPVTFKEGAVPPIFKTTFIVAVLPAFLLLLSIESSYAGSATWKTRPDSGDWNTAANWNPMTVPNGPSDTATFDFSSRTNVSLSADTEVNDITFNPGASTFTITAPPGLTLTFSGAGIINNSGITQNFATARGLGGNQALIQFTNRATAGNRTAFTNNPGSLGEQGTIIFNDNASAGNAIFTNNGAKVGRGGQVIFFGGTAGNGIFINNGGAGLGPAGSTQFFASSTAGNGTFITNGFGAAVEFSPFSTAGNGTFIINGGTQRDEGPTFLFFHGGTAGNGTFFINGGRARDASGGELEFLGGTGGDATFTINGGEVAGANGGLVQFNPQTEASDATLIANGGVGGASGGSIRFNGRARGGKARVEVFGNGNLDISRSSVFAGLKVGSIEGDGSVLLGARSLIVGLNNLSTFFSGVIQDGSTGGSFTKVGRAKLVLRGSSTYTGGTIIRGGKLMVNNTDGSGTGTGPVTVEGGQLGGTGRIAGAVTVGMTSGTGAVLAPGFKTADDPGALTIFSALTFNSDAIYNVQVNSSTAEADQVIANGITINAAQFSFSDLGNGTLPSGTVFTIINNTLVSTITGTFSNLPDGSVFTSNGNSYQVNYEGGDGNDLTLTVVP
jgi:autotransporter-associated beta strand protein